MRPAPDHRTRILAAIRDYERRHGGDAVTRFLAQTRCEERRERMASMFRRAERRKTYVKIALTGPSGSGKTYSALQLAFGLGARVALIDTENGSGSLYAHLGEYDTCELSPPFRVEAYQEAIRAATESGYDVLIIDSLTHAWAGEGGLLAQKEALDARGGNQFTNWASITKQHEAFKSALLHAPIHVLATMRSKAEYVIDQTDGRKSAPRKVGMAPIQRDGMEYEFMTVFDLAADHTAVATKDRTGLFEGLGARLTCADGAKIARWLAGGAEPAPEPEPSDPEREALIQRYADLKGRAKAAGGRIAPLTRDMSAAEIAEMVEIAEATVAGLEAGSEAGMEP